MNREEQTRSACEQGVGLGLAGTVLLLSVWCRGAGGQADVPEVGKVFLNLSKMF